MARNPERASDALADHCADMTNFSHRSNVLSRRCLGGTVIPWFSARVEARRALRGQRSVTLVQGPLSSNRRFLL